MLIMDGKTLELAIVDDTAKTKTQHRGDIMSMRGELISKEYQSMVFVHDKDGREFACYAKDLQNSQNGAEISDREKENCTDLSLVMGDTW